MNKRWIVFTRDVIMDFVHGCLSVIRMLIHSKPVFRSRLTHQGEEDCVILGNGPSLTGSLADDPGFLAGKLCICVNHFPKTSDYERIKPAVFVTSAPDLWLEDIEEKFITSSIALFEQMAQKTTWPLTLLIPFEARPFERWKKPVEKNAHISIVYYNNTPIEGGLFFRHRLFKWNLGMPRPHNVMIPSLFLAINSGVKRVYLLGADHSWLPEIEVNEDNEVLINQKHFYDEKTSKAAPLDKRGKGQRKLWEVLNKFMLAFKGYHTLRVYADARKVEILNATPHSYIDAFERYKKD